MAEMVATFQLYHLAMKLMHRGVKLRHHKFRPLELTECLDVVLRPNPPRLADLATSASKLLGLMHLF